MSENTKINNEDHDETIKELWTQLIGNVKTYNSDLDLSILEHAFEFAKDAHKNQTRKSNQPYIIHPLEVAIILTESHADTTSLIAALLHDVVEDTKTSTDSIRDEFGDLVADIVEGLTKTDRKYEELKSKNYSYEMFRKIMLSAAHDIRILLIKLADRLHNMRTLRYLPRDKQIEKSNETIEIFAPLAEKLGVWKIKSELEDLSLKYTDPEIYQVIKEKVSAKKKEREQITNNFVLDVVATLNQHKIKSRVFGRAKHFYSIYRKMKKKGKALEELYDLIGIRVVTDSIPNCYHILTVLQNKYEMVYEEFDDYIAKPKSNGYMSIQASFKKDNEIFEVQIRTDEMDLFAEYGIGAHWRYKDSGKDAFFDNRIAFIRDILKLKILDPKAEIMLDKVRFNIMGKDIIVLTPKGDPIFLPEGSSPIDFAYAVHSSVGDHCSKAEVNDAIVPLGYELKSGDVVKILTQKNAKPSRQWLNFVRTSSARAKIRKSLGMSVEQSHKRQGASQTELIDFIVFNQSYDKYIKHMAKCCDIKFGIPIKGITTPEKKLYVHNANCPEVQKAHKSRIIDVTWEDLKEKESVIRIITQEKLGILNEILKIFTKNNFMIDSINTEPRKGRIVFDFEIDKLVTEDEMRQMFKDLEEVIEVFVDYK